MFSQLKDKLPHLQPYWDRYIALHQRMEVPAKTILLKEGEVSEKYFFIEKGCLRVWFNNNGKDTTFQFFFENESLKSLESFHKSIPGMFTVETIEPSIIHVLNKKDFDALMNDLDKDPVFIKQLMDLIFERQLYYMREFLSFIRDTPRQRYENLLQQRPQIVQRVPQHYIASYLGISTVHLSRIKSKLLREK